MKKRSQEHNLLTQTKIQPTVREAEKLSAEINDEMCLRPRAHNEFFH